MHGMEYKVYRLIIYSINQCIQHNMHVACIVDSTINLALTLCIMQEVEQYEEQADGYSTRMSDQEQHDMEPGITYDTSPIYSELSQDFESSNSGKISCSMHAL